MARRTLTISIPATMRTFVETRTLEKDHISVSEYIRELIRRDQQTAAYTRARLTTIRRQAVYREPVRYLPDGRDPRQ